MEYAKANHLPVIALNAPVELTRKVSKGGLEALTTAERAQLPAVIHPPIRLIGSSCRRFLRRILKDKQQFENFLLVQRIWEETMAQQRGALPRKSIRSIRWWCLRGWGISVMAPVFRRMWHGRCRGLNWLTAG